MISSKIICPVCCHEENDLFAEKGDFNYFKCRQCFVVHINPLPDLKDFADKVYDRYYFVKEDQKKDFGYADYDQDKKPMINTFKAYLKLMEELSGKGKKLLDVGAATGFFLKIARDRGWQVSGVEISEYAANLAAADGLNVVNGTINDYPENTNFDAITYLDVFEHLADPKKELDEVKKRLGRDGLILINTPDAKSLFSKIFGKNWHSFMPPEHIVLYNPSNLAGLLSQNGFEVLMTKKIGKKFSLPYIFQILYNWLGWKALLNFSNFFSRPIFARINIPLNLHDNFLVIARKKE